MPTLTQLLLDRDRIDVAIQRERLAGAPLRSAIALELGGATWTVKDLYTLAETSPELKRAIGNRSPKILGKFLAHIEGNEFDGLAIEKVAEVRDGWIWRVRLVEGA
jgi:hypothetical protein